MKPLYVINDTHIGAIRTGGVTPATAYELRLETLARFGDLLGWARGGDLLINGDLFDKANIPYTDMWTAIEMCAAWLQVNPDSKLYAAAGNHDLSKNTTVMSSFELFCKIMSAMAPGQFLPIFGPTQLIGRMDYVIPHLPNQDLFDAAIAAVPAGTKYLFLHCNYENNFAVEADHSLNLSAAQAEKLQVERIVIGHEHQRSEHMAGKVLALGNQIPTSVADCLGNSAKYMLKIHSDKMEFMPTWNADRDFARPDWRDLTTITEGARFIRVEGEATAAEASEVIAAISRLRSRSKALVITNAVAIDGRREDDEFKMSLESMKSFDVLEELYEILGPDDAALIKELLEKNNVQTSQAE